MSIFCKTSLHWPLQRKCKAFIDAVSGRQVYFCQCNCGQYWLAEGRYSFFKTLSIHPEAWITDLTDLEKYLKGDEK